MFLISNGAQALTIQEILFTPLPTGFTGHGYNNPTGQAPVPPSFGGATGQVLGASTTGLVGYWKMDESSGITAADSSGQSNTATLSGGSFVAGNIGNALSLNGSTNYADVGNPASLQLTSSMTLSAWVFATANPADDGQIIAKGDNTTGWQFKTSPDTGPHTFGMKVGTAQRYSTTVRQLNIWYHVTGVYNAGTQTLDIYVNGVLDNGTLIGAVPTSQTNANVNVNIGQRTGGYNFAGKIDELRVYNRALTTTEVTDVYNDTGAPAPLTAPTISSFSASPTSISQGNSSTLSWSVSGNPSPTLSINNGVGTVSGTNISVSPSVTTTYTLTATNSQGNTTAQSTVTVTAPPPPDTTAPTVPSGLSATAISSSQINLAWTASTDNVSVTGYKIFRAGSQIGISATNSYSDTGLTASTLYTYTVSAYDAAGNNSAQSSSASATTQAPPVSGGAGSPTLFFTDLESGPKTGGENNNGAYVTIYGNNFGSSQYFLIQ